MKVFKLTDEHKKILGALQAEQAKLQAAQQELNGRIKTAMDAFSTQTGMQQPFVISDDGDFAVEATRGPGRHA